MLTDVQRWLYSGISARLKAAEDLSVLPELFLVAIVFGVLHALTPGHGKSVLVSYHLGREGRTTDGLLTGIILALTHIGSAVVFVLAGMAVISRTLGANSRTQTLQTASAIMIIAIGAFLLWRSRRAHRHAAPTDGRVLAFVSGLVPCPLTTFILTFSIARHQLAAGLVAVGGMAVGVTLTLTAFAVAAIYARGRFMGALERSQGWRARLGRGAELASALAVIVLGLFMLPR